VNAMIPFKSMLKNPERKVQQQQVVNAMLQQLPQQQRSQIEQAPVGAVCISQYKVVISWVLW